MCFAGAPVKPELYDFVLQHIKRVFFGNGSGGTDICSALYVFPALLLVVVIYGLNLEQYRRESTHQSAQGRNTGAAFRHRPTR